MPRVRFSAWPRGLTGLAKISWVTYIRCVESPKSVNAFLLTFVGFVLLGLLVLSIYIHDLTFFFEAIGILALVALGCMVYGFLLGVVTSPLVWLLSRFSGRPPKHKP